MLRGVFLPCRLYHGRGWGRPADQVLMNGDSCMSASVMRKLARKVAHGFITAPHVCLWFVLGGYKGFVWLRHSCYVYLFDRWAAGDHTWYDHRLDELMWPGNLFWVERGVMGTLHLKPGDKVLDCCCGDGYFSGTFWNRIAGHIDAVDRDDAALDLARKAHGHPTINYTKVDIVEDPFPGTDYDVVFFFEAIEHLSKETGHLVIDKIKNALKPGGRLIGSTTQINADDRGSANKEHDNEFESVDALCDFLKQTFVESEVSVTYHPERTTLYYVCIRSDE